MKKKKGNSERNNINNKKARDKEKEKIENSTFEKENVKNNDNKKYFNEKEDKEWIKILEEELDKFSLGSFEEDMEEENQKELLNEELPEEKIKSKEKPILMETLNHKKLLVNNNTNKTELNYKTELNKEEIDDKIISGKNDSIFFEGKEFKKYSRYNIYNSKRKIKKIIYKCINNRKDDRIRRATNQPTFCNATIEYIEPGQNIKSGFFIKSFHSEECIEMDYIKSIKNIKEKVEKEEGKDTFITLCQELMDKSTIYDRRIFKEEFKKIYNKNKYSFPLNDNLLSNIITQWKKTSDRFTKMCIFKNKYDNDNRLILRDYRIIPIKENEKISTSEYEYIIWGNNENISRMRQSKNFFIDGTFHHPPEFKQLLLIMYKDIITGIKIPGLYILLNSKKEMLYKFAFKGIIDLLTDNNNITLKVETVVTDQEKALINVVNTYFPNAQRISCLFHYKQDILKNLKSYGLYNKSNKKESNIILYELGKYPFKFKGDINYINKECSNLIKSYPLYENFINNYFLKNHLNYFKDNSLNYSNIPNDCRSNSFLENYNGYIKQKLGKHLVVNWVNFIEFIKSESSRSIEKLLNSANSKFSAVQENISINTLKEAIKNQPEIDDIIIEPEYYDYNNPTETKENILRNNINKDEMINTIINSTLGMKNIGDTCYMNAAIQILIHLKKLLEKIVNLVCQKKGNLTNALLELICDIYELIISSDNNPFIKNSILYYSPINFKMQFTNKYAIFNNGQHDSMEFISLLLRELVDDSSDVKSKTQYHEIDNNNKTKEEVCNEYNDFFNKREHTYIHDLFYFQTITTYSCICGYNSYTCENLLEIPLLLEDEKDNLTLKELLNNFFGKEEIPWDEKCWKCKKKKKKHSKFIRLYNVNDYFIITLQRYDSETSKINNSLITFEPILNLKDYFDEQLFKGKSNFILKGTINHFGKLNSGHYFCFIKIENEWFKFNDCNVEKISQMDFSSDSAYVLIYEKE